MESLEQNQPNRVARVVLASSMLFATIGACSVYSRERPVNVPALVVAPSPTSSPEAIDLPEILSPPTDAPVVKDPVVALQETLNIQLPGLPKLELDGKLGPQTIRAICATRFLSGKEASKAKPDANERAVLSKKQKLSAPLSGLVINRTCQIMAVNIDKELSMILPVSTGSKGHTTPAGHSQIQYGRFGWHNSSIYPTESGNGNMYKPLYFNGPIAVHCANDTSPAVTTPRSHGCVRVTLPDADKPWKLAGGPENSKQDRCIGDLKPIPVHVI